MDTSLQVDQTLGMVWKKRDKKREKMYSNKLCNFLKLIGKLKAKYLVKK